MTITTDTQPAADSGPATADHTIAASPSGAVGAGDATSAQPSDDGLPIPVAIQLREMDAARAAVAQAAALLLQPVAAGFRARELFRSARSEADVVSELRQALRELRQII